jgi:hypothetical protein
MKLQTKVLNQKEVTVHKSHPVKSKYSSWW